MKSYPTLDQYAVTDDDNDTIICLHDEALALLDDLPNNPIFIAMIEDLKERLHAEMQRADATPNQPRN